MAHSKLRPSNAARALACPAVTPKPAAPRRLFTIRMIHRLYDWDATLTFEAPSHRTARAWALVKMATPSDWLVVSAAVVKAAS